MTLLIKETRLLLQHELFLHSLAVSRVWSSSPLLSFVLSLACSPSLALSTPACNMGKSRILSFERVLLLSVPCNRY